MKSPEFERMSPRGRRRFLQLMGAALAAPFVPDAVRYAAHDMCGVAEADAPLEATYFLEVNLRDQWDHGQFFTAPGLATYADLKRGETGQAAAIFYDTNQFIQKPNNVYLTLLSQPLEPHLEDIAMIDCCEVAVGAIHGHEAANPMRSPGRTYAEDATHKAMFLNDPVANFPQGVEAYYSSTPTPATFHNYLQKQAGFPKNGYTFKGISRSIHTAYHYGADLPGAELDRMQSRDMLFGAFPDSVEDLSVLPTQEQADAMARILSKVDPKFLQRRHYQDAAITGHSSNVEEARKLLHSNQTKVIHLPLDEAETAYWGDGIPDQVGVDIKAQIWEQFAWAQKLFEADLARSVAVEFDYVDVHDQRTVGQMETETMQAAHTLARFIQKMKDANLWEKTLVTIYCCDGGRSPAAGSFGSEGKNTIIMAGGMIKGGYYGDVQVAGDSGNGHTYRYHAPDLTTGVPGPGVTDNSQRVPGAYIWRTVMKALGIPDAQATQFPDVASASPLSWMLKA